MKLSGSESQRLPWTKIILLGRTSPFGKERFILLEVWVEDKNSFKLFSDGIMLSEVLSL